MSWKLQPGAGEGGGRGPHQRDWNFPGSDGRLCVVVGMVGSPTCQLGAETSRYGRASGLCGSHPEAGGPPGSLLPSTEMCLYGGGLPGGLAGKIPPATAADVSSIPGSGRSPGGGNGSPLQYSCWSISWTEEAGGLQSMRSQRVRHG